MPGAGGTASGAAAGARQQQQRDLQASALLRSVTHDLRTPLAAIRAVVSDLYEGVEYDDETRHELLETVLDEVDRLDRVVANLLAASRIEAGAMEPRPATVDLDELLHDRVRALRSLLRDHDVTVDAPSALPDVAADYGQLEQVVVNLLANAARHTPPGTTVQVLAAVDAGGDAVRVSVVDDDPGIPGEIAERLFEPFVHGPSSRSTGLGLAISRSIVEAHGGAIGVESLPAAGTTVWFTVPTVQPLAADVLQAGEA